LLQRRLLTLSHQYTEKILLNGHLSDSIDIKKGNNQGNTLSCAFFILEIHLLIRNVNKDTVIKNVEIRTNINKSRVKCKAGAYADDVSAICKSDRNNVQMVF
jgi:hypothetical protein